MKSKYGLLMFLPLLLASCAGPPTLSKSTTTDNLSLSLAAGSPAVTGSGGFYDYSQSSTTISGGVTTVNSYTETTFSFPGGPYSFNDMTHDTLGFAVTVTGASGPVTFSYQLDGISGTGVANSTYTSGRISF